MRRKALMVSFLILLISFMIPCVKAYAAFEVHMVDQVGKNSPSDFRDGDTFQLSETPYLYFNVPSLQSITFGGSFWLDPNNTLIATPAGQVSSGDIWMTLDWNSISKTPGLWTVQGWYMAHTGQGAADATTFRYAPEPISTILFLTGGTVLVVRRLRRKNK